MEDWVEIKGFPNYMISNWGRVCNWETGVVLKPGQGSGGYPLVCLRREGTSNTKHVHRLVAEAFVPGWDEGLDVNHIDGDKLNNHESNLEWVTRSMNLRHALDVGLRRNRTRSVHVVETGETFPSIKSCAEQLGILPSGICSVLRGRAPHYKGLRFEYVD